MKSLCTAFACVLCLSLPSYLTAQVGPGIITTFAGNFPGDGGPAAEAWLNYPSSVAADAKGFIYIAEGNRIRRVSPDGIITTIAGTGVGGFSGDGGLATQARLNYPSGVAVDTKGNVYIADQNSHRIRRVGPDGIITTFAGSTSIGSTGGSEGGFSGDGGAAVQAQLNHPQGVTVDAQGNVYIADAGNNRIRRAGPDGIITTFAGGGTTGLPPPSPTPQPPPYPTPQRQSLPLQTGTPPPSPFPGETSGDGGPAVQARLSSPSGVAVDAKGNVYIADQGNNRIRRVGAGGIITTFAGTGTRGLSGDGGLATQAGLSSPAGVAVDAKGFIYIADGDNNRIRRVGPDSVITTFAGGASNFGDGGPAIQAYLGRPRAMAVDAAGVVYIADYDNRRVRRVGADGVITTFAGAGRLGLSKGGGLATQTSLANPRGVAVDAKGFVYLAEGIRVSRVGSDGIFTTFAGTGIPGFSGDGGPATQAQLYTPSSVAVDVQGNIYIADSGRIRRVGADGIITTFAGGGTPPPGSIGDGGPATQASLYSPTGVAVDAKGFVYIADPERKHIRRVGPDGMITTFAGTGTQGPPGDGGPATQANLNFPRGVAVDAKGFVYIADSWASRIRRVGPDGIITTFAGGGSPPSGSIGDGGPATQASLNFPTGIAVDTKENVYIADGDNYRIRRVDPNGTIITVAGTGVEGSSGDGGPALQAQLSHPQGVAVDAKGNIYIADLGNQRIRQVDGSPAGAGGLASDFDGNGEVGFDDFFAFAGAFGQKATGTNVNYDLDRNGEVDFNDFFLFAGDFGKTIKSGKTAALSSTR